MQATDELEPAEDEYFPTPHAVHADSPTASPKLPGGQASHPDAAGADE